MQNMKHYINKQINAFKGKKLKSYLFLSVFTIPIEQKQTLFVL